MFWRNPCVQTRKEKTLRLLKTETCDCGEWFTSLRKFLLYFDGNQCYAVKEDLSVVQILNKPVITQIMLTFAY